MVTHAVSCSLAVLRHANWSVKHACGAEIGVLPSARKKWVVWKYAGNYGGKGVDGRISAVTKNTRSVISAVFSTTTVGWGHVPWKVAEKPNTNLRLKMDLKLRDRPAREGTVPFDNRSSISIPVTINSW